MDWRHRRYFAVQLPYHSHNHYIRLIKSIPHVKVHPVKYPDSHNRYVNRRNTFQDEENPRGYHNIVVSVWGLEETHWLISGLVGMKGRGFNCIYSGFTEILPRRKNEK